MQEEFNRYTGYWWQESSSADEPFRILYDEIDESEVQCFPAIMPVCARTRRLCIRVRVYPTARLAA